MDQQVESGGGAMKTTLPNTEGVQCAVYYTQDGIEQVRITPVVGFIVEFDGENNDGETHCWALLLTRSGVVTEYNFEARNEESPGFHYKLVSKEWNLAAEISRLLILRLKRPTEAEKVEIPA
jgi:hypothetical protein